MSKLVFVVAGLLLFSSTASAQVQTFTMPAGQAPTPGQPAAPQRPPRDNAQQTGTARIRGRVFAADTGSPLRKAQVRVFAAELREQRMTSTDAEGRYEFKDLPAGRYNMSASKGSYVQLAYGQQRPFESGKPLQVLDGQTIDKVDFTLPRGGIVTGRIADEFGDPIADVQVSAMRYQFVQGRRQLVPSGRSAQTNDIGEFRMFGLPPGQYYVSAMIRNFAMMGGTSDDRSGYSPTYYPGTGNVSEAQRVTVAVGQTVSNVNMSLVPTRTSQITGVVIDADGKPATGGMVIVQQRSIGFGFASMGGQIKPDGSFVVSNVAPGDYTLQANVGGSGDAPLFATAKVTVTGDDLDGVRLTAARPAVMTGRIVIKSATPNTAVRGTTFRVNAMPASADEIGPAAGGGGAASDDLTFEIRVRPCVCVIRSFGPPNGYYLRAVRLNGVDVTDSGIEFRPDQEISGVEVEMTNQPTDLSGLVTDRRGDPSHDYTVVLFARDPERWRPNSRYLATGRPDQDGRFKIRGVPGGDYYAIALEYVEPGEWSDPEFLERVRQNAVTVSINDGETKTVDLKLVTGT